MLADELFKRSHLFRAKLCSEFHEFLKLTCGIEKAKLPPPLCVAKSLREEAVRIVQSWSNTYGEVYKEVGKQ